MQKLLLLIISMTVSIASVYSQNNGAQKFSDKGMVIITLGSDTTFIHDYNIKGLEFESKILNFIGGLRYLEGNGQFDQQGNIKNVQSTLWQYGQDAKWSEVSKTSIYTTIDSTFIVSNRSGTQSKVAYKERFLLNNSGDAVSFQLFPFMAAKAPSKQGDSVVYKHVNAIGYRDFIIKRISESEITVRSSFMGAIRLFVDKKNRLQSIDALGSSLNFTAKVYRNLSIENYKKNAEQNFKSKQTLAISTRDTLKFQDGEQKIEILYWQPSARGRKVFGGIVPNNKFWRFGANNATRITLAHHIISGKTIIPSGEYSLFAVPSNDSWLLKFNSKSRVWGTEYDPTFDVASIPMSQSKLNEHIDKFKIKIESTSKNKGQLIADWENTRLSFDFENLIMPASTEKAIKKEVIISENINKIWDKWSSNVGLESFFAPKANIVLESGGPFEIYFFPDNPVGFRGAEDTKVIAFENEKMISFTWNAPPNFPEIRKQKTLVIVRLNQEGSNKTKVSLEHIGWGSSPEWIGAVNYFNKAWETILGRLKYSVEKGVIDWKNPPSGEAIKLE